MTTHPNSTWKKLGLCLVAFGMAGTLLMSALALASTWGGERYRVSTLEGRVKNIEDRTSQDHDILIEIRRDVRAINARLDRNPALLPPRHTISP